jgi:hypothetical protein
LTELLAVRRPIYLALAHLTVVCGSQCQETIAEKIIQHLEHSFDPLRHEN